MYLDANDGLCQWFCALSDMGGADKKLDILSAREGVKKMRYTEEQRQVALKLYDETHSVSKVIHRLGLVST